MTYLLSPLRPTLKASCTCLRVSLPSHQISYQFLALGDILPFTPLFNFDKESETASSPLSFRVTFPPSQTCRNYLAPKQRLILFSSFGFFGSRRLSFSFGASRSSRRRVLFLLVKFAEKILFFGVRRTAPLSAMTILAFLLALSSLLGFPFPAYPKSFRQTHPPL